MTILFQYSNIKKISTYTQIKIPILKFNQTKNISKQKITIT